MRLLRRGLRLVCLGNGSERNLVLGTLGVYGLDVIDGEAGAEGGVVLSSGNGDDLITTVGYNLFTLEMR